MRSRVSKISFFLHLASTKSTSDSGNNDLFIIIILSNDEGGNSITQIKLNRVNYVAWSKYVILLRVKKKTEDGRRR